MDMEYVYLVGCGLWLAVLGVFAVLRLDLVKRVAIWGLVGGVLGLIAEFFYFRDYWLPPTTMGIGRISPEDFLFGLSMAMIGIVAYPTLWKKDWSKSEQPKRIRFFGLLFAVGLASLLLFNVGLGVNSIIVSSVNFAVLAAIMICLRRDLLKPALYTSAVITLLAILIYTLLFNVWAPDFWDRYWLLSGTGLGAKVLGNIPLTELMWYASWGLFAGVAYPFASGKRFESVK